VVMPASMCDDEVRVLVFKPNISQSEAAFNPTSDHQQNPLQPGIFDADIDIGIKSHASKSAQWKEWYEKITIQNLLDHKAGFKGGGDVEGATKMFGVSEDELTYEQVHRHFLRNRELLHAPDTEYEYSNHGFGLWTLLIEKMSTE
jgi:hypothetical protein